MFRKESNVGTYSGEKKPFSEPSISHLFFFLSCPGLRKHTLAWNRHVASSYRILLSHFFTFFHKSRGNKTGAVLSLYLFLHPDVHNEKIINNDCNRYIYYDSRSKIKSKQLRLLIGVYTIHICIYTYIRVCVLFSFYRFTLYIISLFIRVLLGLSKK